MQREDAILEHLHRILHHLIWKHHYSPLFPSYLRVPLRPLRSRARSPSASVLCRCMAESVPAAPVRARLRRAGPVRRSLRERRVLGVTDGSLRERRVPGVTDGSPEASVEFLG